MTDDRNFALEYRVRKQREDQSREIIREIEERRAVAACPIGSCQRHGRCMYLNHPRCGAAKS